MCVCAHNASGQRGVTKQYAEVVHTETVINRFNLLEDEVLLDYAQALSEPLKSDVPLPFSL